MTYLHPFGGRAALLSAAASLSVITALPGAVKTWDGAAADDNWQTPQNWNADTAPAADDQLVFAGTVRPTPVNNHPAATPFNGITANTGAASFTLSGNAITLTRGITAGGPGTVSGGNITNSSANPLNIALPITLSTGKYTINSPVGGGGINFTGAFTRGVNSSVVFTRTGNGGQINFAGGTGLANDASGILGGWAMMGNDWAALDGSGNVVPYTGYTAIATGAIPLSAPNANYLYTNETANITAAAGTKLNTLSASISAARTLTISGQMRLGPKGGIYRQGTSAANNVLTVTGGTITAEGGGEINLWDATTNPGNFAATANNLRIDSVMTNDGTSPVSVNIMGYLDIRGANTYSGGTFINQGRVQAQGIAVFGTGPVTVYQGGQAFVNAGAGSFANSFTVTGNGTTETNSNVNDGPGAIRIGSNGTVSGPVTYSGATRLTSSSTGGGGTFSGRISGTGPLQFGGFGSSPAFMNLSNIGTPNDWNGPLTISALSTSRAFTLRLGANNQIPDNTDVTVTTAGTVASTFELNGFSETIGALNSAVNTGLIVVSATTGANSTLTFGATNANADYGGTLRDNSTSTLNLVKTGTGKQILRGAVDTVGTVTINGGTLEWIGTLFNNIGDMTVNTGGTFQASGTISSANVTLAGGTLRPSLAGLQQLSLFGNLNIGTGSILDVNTSGFPAPAVDVLGVVNTTATAGTVTVNINGTEPAVGQHQLIKYGTLTGTGASAFVLGQKPPRMVASIIDDPGSNAVVLDVTASGIAAQWTGAVSSEWSTATQPEPKNWVLSSNPLTTTDFLNLDAVLFNDSAANNTVDLSVEDVTASSVTFNNTDDTYQLTGTKGFTGAGPMVKNGTGSVTISNPNTFSGGTTINAGTIQLNTGGSLGTGAIINEGLLVLNRTDNTTFANAISGEGDLHLTSAATTTISGVSTYNGDTTISAGTARVTNGAAFGAAGGAPVQVQAGSAVDIAGNPTANNLNFGAKQFLISGNGPTGTGALVNSGTVNQQNAFQEVALEADASVGASARFDIRGGAPTLDLNGHTLRKRGTNQFTLVAVGVEDGGTIIVEQGTFAVETTTVTYGNGAVICEPGSYAAFYQNNTTLDPENNVLGVSWPYTLREGVVTGNAGTQPATILSPFILEGNASLNGFQAGVPDPNQAVRPLTLTGNITENGGSYSLTKNGLCEVTLTGTASTYTGATLVNDGTLIVNGNLTASPVSVEADATLGGTGTLGGTLSASGLLTPGMAAIGTFTTGAATLNGTCTLAMQINSTALTSDKLAVNGSLTLGGVLGVNDLGPATLPPGSKFTIATYTGALAGAFANVADGGTLVIGPNTFQVDYDEVVTGGHAVTLTVPAGTPYDAWATAKGLDGTNNGKLADPDHDGLENILEFALDGAPLTSASDGKVRVAVADVDAGAPVDLALTLTFPVRNGAVFSGPGDLVSAAVDHLVYSIQGTTGLGDFTTLNVTEVTPALSAGMPALSTGWEYRSFRGPGNPGNPNKSTFLRVDVADSP